jgi:hypothetical protein
MRVQIISTQGKAETASINPLAVRYARRLRTRLGVTAVLSKGVPLERVAEVVRSSSADAVLMAFGWDVPAETLVDLLRPLYEREKRPKLVFVDWYDQTSSPHFGVLPYVDAYVKPQMLRDVSWYRADLVGGYAFTDFLAREMGVRQEDFHFGSVPDPEFAYRLVLGWNIGCSPAYRVYLHAERWLAPQWTKRRVHVQARFGMGPNPEGWYAFHRRSAAEAAARLRDKYDVRSDGLLGRRRYMRELRNSRIALSPFGWGEICFRDFDAACRGCLLLKPSMEHLVTSPDIFVPHETYVPLRWDLADQERTCRLYLEDPAESMRIAGNAREAYRQYFARGGFVEDFARLVRHLEHPPEPRVHELGTAPPWRGVGQRVPAPVRR